MTHRLSLCSAVGGSGMQLRINNRCIVFFYMLISIKYHERRVEAARHRGKFTGQSALSAAAIIIFIYFWRQNTACKKKKHSSDLYNIRFLKKKNIF